MRYTSCLTKQGKSRKSNGSVISVSRDRINGVEEHDEVDCVKLERQVMSLKLFGTMVEKIER